MELTHYQKEYIRCASDPVYFLNTYGYVFNAKLQKVTRMTCFKYQERCLNDFHEHRNNIILKSRQCLPLDTFIDTPQGPQPIQDLKIGDEIYSFNSESKNVEVDKVKDAWESGEKSCVKFKLQDTRNFESGENHPFLVKEKGWVRAQDLIRGDEIVDVNVNFGETNANDDEIKILAYLITDGCTNKQVKFTNNNLEYLTEFENSVKKIFSLLEMRKSPKLKGYDYYPHQAHGANTINPIMEWCEKKNIANKKTIDKLLPKEVFSWNKKSLSLLINRMFAGDGWVSIYTKKNSKRIELGTASPSEHYLQQVKFLLKKFNIKCNIYEVKNMKLQKNRFFKLRITHSKSVIRFIEEIGIYKKIKNEHYDICKNYKHNVKDGSIVKKIETTEVKKTFDITVEKNENFLINGLVVHNTGLSVITAGYVAWRLIFRKDEKILIIANDGDGAVRFLATVKQFLDYTPNWLLPGDGVRTIDNQKFLELSNGSHAQAKASSQQAGRGDSLTLLVMDETAFIEHANSIWMAAGMALSATQGKCIMISTPNGTGNLYHNTWDIAERGENDFVHSTVHWTENKYCIEGIETRKDNNGEEYFWSPWYEEQCRRYQYDKVKIAQELDLSFEGSKRLAIEADLVAKYEKRFLLDEYKDIAKNKTYYDYRAPAGKRFIQDETGFHVFKKYVSGHKYLLGCDVARGDGKDFSTIQIIDIDTLEVVAEFQGRISPDLFAILIYNVAHDFGEAYVVVEANSFGLATAFDLNRKMGYKRMFFSKNIKQIYVSPYDYNVDVDESIPGFQTSKRTRPLIINNLRTHLRDGLLKIYSKRIISELRTFIQNGDRQEAEKGKNDDLIFALAIALFIRDTDYKNAAASSEMYKGMLEAFGCSSTSIQGDVHSTYKGGAEIDDVPPDAGGIFYNYEKESIEEHDIDDIDWLLGRK